MTTFGIKVSKPGYDATTAAKENLVFSSEYDTLKLFYSGSGSVSVPNNPDPWIPGGVTVEITHNLGYKPVFFCFSTNPWWSTDDKFSPYTWRSIGSPYNGADYACDTNKIYLTFWNPDPENPDTVYYRYHIYYNKLA